MTRVLFRRAIAGHRAVRGEPIRRLQAALTARGADTGGIDGIFGGDTEKAVRAWQLAQGNAVTGVVTDDAWRSLTGQEMPSLRDRALQLTADFEGHGFGKVAGNFDGAWLTWGVIGFTLKHGELRAIIFEIRDRHPLLLDQAFGPLKAELLTALAGNAAAQEAFGNAISLGAQRYKVKPEWEAAFATLGSFAEVQAIQQRGVEKYWERAVRDAERFGLTEELSYALCFDIAVQNGGVDTGQEESRIRERFAGGALDEAAKRFVIANVVAENSKPQYVEDVRSRKQTIAMGMGQVHGATYSMADWGLADLSAS